MKEWLLLSLKVSICTTLLTLLLGTGVAYLLARRRFPGRSVVEALSLLPLVMPPTVLGYYLLVVMGVDSAVGRWYTRLTGTDLVFSFTGIVIAAFVGSIPLFIRQAQVAFAEVDRDLEDSARSCGASEGQVFRYITLPLARRGLIAGTVLAFARSLGDFGATLMVGGNIPGQTRTLALAVYDTWQAGDNATASGLALLLASVAFFIAIFASRLTQEHQR
jgi:molybdate transport system permease protein